LWSQMSTLERRSATKKERGEETKWNRRLLRLRNASRGKMRFSNGNETGFVRDAHRRYFAEKENPQDGFFWKDWGRIETKRDNAIQLGTNLGSNADQHNYQSTLLNTEKWTTVAIA